MEFTVAREALVRGLHLVQGVVERRNTLPILSNIHVEAKGESVTFTATDMDVGMRAQIAAQVKTPGTVTVNARKTFEIARESSGTDVTLRATTAGWVELGAGRSKFKVVSLDPKDFPELPFTTKVGGVTLKVATATLREMLDKVAFAVSTDETRFNLSGVYVETVEGKTLRMVATDGHRLSLVDRAVADATLPKGVIMPRKGVAELRKLLDEVEIAEVSLVIGEKDVRLETPDLGFFMRLLEGEFPDYRQVIPSGQRVKAQVAHDDLHAALRRMSLLASERSHGVRFGFERGRLDITASNPDQGEASEDLEMSYNGDPMNIGFNAKYVLDVLAVHAPGDSVEIGLSDEVGPGVFRSAQDPGHTYVVMPMRL